MTGTARNALVLGATRGIGRAIAMALAESGSRIIAPYYDWPEESLSLGQHLATLPGDHLVVKADLRDPDQVKGLLALVGKECGNLHILINNIERGGMPIVHGPYTPEQWDLEMDTTVKAKWWVFNEALPLLKKAENGVVINISSIAGEVGRAGPAGLIFNDAYAAANRAVTSFTRTWAKMAAPLIRVNELRLGFFETRHAEGTRGWELLTRAERQAIHDRTLLQRSGTLGEVVKAVLFLINDATFMTGSTLCLDGGYTLGHDLVPALPNGQGNLGVRVAD
jgi:3-oxoacyl-[acyl-carrier protein] reductase